MDKIKLEKFERTLKELMTPEILQYSRENSDVFWMVTVLEVKLSSDFNYADIYVTGQQNQEKLAKFLASFAPELKKMISRKLSLRKTPQIRFRIDKKEEKNIKMYNLLDEIKKEIWDE